MRFLRFQNVRQKLFWYKYYIATAGLLLFIIYWRLLPAELFEDPVSLVLEDKNGRLLGAMIAADEQWRFPYNEDVPEKFRIAITHFEDKRFHRHPGVDPLALGRAMYHNVKSGRVTSGGSTLSMQVIRLSRKGKRRNVYEKFVEMILATRMEISYSKADILALYASNAPFGGNIVGLDAACWRYFGKSPQKISWSEAATLAVLPNSPSQVNPGRNREILIQKRNRLLKRLYHEGELDEMSYEMALMEPLPNRPYPLPRIAPHLLSRVFLENTGYRQHALPRFRTTLDIQIQRQVNGILDRHYQELRRNEIHNTAAIVVEVETGEVIAYTGNIMAKGYDNGGHVDMITSHRSSGSILKPFLYAAMLHEGSLLPDALIPDIPSQFGAFTPKNFNYTHDGAVPARRALARSLNVPAVRLLLSYSTVRFHHLLKSMGMTTLTQPADHYGLALMLGGAEATLWDMAGIYAGMARTLNHFDATGNYLHGAFHPPVFYPSENSPLKREMKHPEYLDAASIYLTFEAMVEVTRPEEDESWQYFSSSQPIAWKTGTSFGNRDAWAIGVTPGYVVAVWAGNADGEGRPGLTGIGSAAPIMFDIFNLVKSNSWFRLPYEAMDEELICTKSGFRASRICEKTVERWIPLAGRISPVCPYHTTIHLESTGKYRVHGDCESPLEMQTASWFVLPPVMENLFRNKNPQYASLPPFREDCQTISTASGSMDIIYPKAMANIYIPVELTGARGKTVFEVSHRNRETVIYWHINDTYHGYTKGLHQKSFSPMPGSHRLVLVDENGERLERHFTILDSR